MSNLFTRLALGAVAIFSVAVLSSQTPIFILPILATLAVVAVVIGVLLFTNPGDSDGIPRADDSNWRHW